MQTHVSAVWQASQAPHSRSCLAPSHVWLLHLCTATLPLAFPPARLDSNCNLWTRRARVERSSPTERIHARSAAPRRDSTPITWPLPSGSRADARPAESQRPPLPSPRLPRPRAQRPIAMCAACALRPLLLRPLRGLRRRLAVSRCREARPPASSRQLSALAPRQLQARTRSLGRRVNRLLIRRGPAHTPYPKLSLLPCAGCALTLTWP
eukprot:scaffold886_cov317-Prasinococcus_capsulatus_cf.AAC.13